MVKSEQIVGFVKLLEKFRKTIITMFVIVIIVSSFMYFEADYIIGILSKPVHGVDLYFMRPAEGMMVKMKIAFLGGIIISFPFIAYLLIHETGSRLTVKVRRILYFFVTPVAILLFIMGVLFGYKLLLPSTIDFLLDCGNEFMKANLSGDNYFSFVITMLLTTGLIFELPLFLIALSRINIINSKMLKEKRKIALMVSLIAVALITPSVDAMTFILVALPITGLYEISIWCVYLLEKKDERNQSSKLEKSA
ncbi:Sec-independent protein translocase protein TatC [Clostridium pasteurianum DSM 525 = ATCC 6013]|uniref:Sec-independent protein translocase protein TatC n=1 Tax=Clostridium pasteurianum DSM 525 = ATCC 6013 TaxID=1262449 RepID=A0A0H3J242_CLOPA|nr:twin-arginine translocase subunit TatC [Clostridium pasteurianum]AJA46812.1 Sec-independent protein translocase protein TatC [Clostridium pasteurianum DSM 525 = ATCC 6013]AJA50800.1 Sec-independent protein translocase protein TatC [Clostridium pasteurianum DSM 525 = ATCC 6013]AOZ74206.1 Sec-independent protein secretion pathway component TatC [Clostridium pasteurianum DSM 525 = ATCC 6013]AOZ78004.1 Sec-independent protein secretion pathway component TatC [Clostridium pasteurianum]ELP58577.1